MLQLFNFPWSQNPLKSESKGYCFCKVFMCILSLACLHKSSITHLISVEVCTFTPLLSTENLCLHISFVLVFSASTYFKELAYFSSHRGNSHIWIRKMVWMLFSNSFRLFHLLYVTLGIFSYDITEKIVVFSLYFLEDKPAYYSCSAFWHYLY